MEPTLSDDTIKGLLTFITTEAYMTKIDVLDTPTCEKLCEYLESKLNISQEDALCLIRGFFGFAVTIPKRPFYPCKT